MKNKKDEIRCNYKEIASNALSYAASFPCNLCIYQRQTEHKKDCSAGYKYIGACPVVKEIRRKLSNV